MLPDGHTHTCAHAHAHTHAKRCGRYAYVMGPLNGDHWNIYLCDLIQIDGTLRYERPVLTTYPYCLLNHVPLLLKHVPVLLT